MADEITISINLDALTVGDLVLLDKAARGEIPMSDLVDLLDRVVEGGVRHLPLTALPKIIEALNAEVSALTPDAKN